MTNDEVSFARFRAMGDIIDSLDKAAARIGQIGSYREHGVLMITSAGVHIDGKAWLGLGHVQGAVAPLIVLFLPVLRRYDGEFVTGESMTYGEPYPAMTDTIRDHVLSACEAQGLTGMKFGMIRRLDDGRSEVYIRREDGRRHIGFVTTASFDSLAKSAVAFAEDACARGWVTAPKPCPTCAEFPMMCEFHGAQNVAKLNAGR